MRNLILAAILVLPLRVYATVFWTEDWEGDGAAVSARWNEGSCMNPADWVDNNPNGVNSSPARSAMHAYTGSYGLQYHFTGLQPDHGGCYQFRSFTPTDDMWIRWYEYWGTGMTTAGGDVVNGGIGGAGTKRHYMYGTHGGAIPYTYMWGARSITVSCQYCKDNADGTTNGGGVGTTWPNGTTSNYYPNMGSFSMPDNQWVCWEAHFKLNTPGQADGVTEMWATNMTLGTPTVQTLGYYNKEFRGARVTDPWPSDSHWSKWEVYTQDGLGDIWDDDYAVGDTRIGCGPTPPSDTTSPAAPKGLRIL